MPVKNASDRPRPNTRSTRRVPADLRKQLLKEQTCKKLLDVGTLTVDNGKRQPAAAAPSKPDEHKKEAAGGTKTSVDKENVRPKPVVAPKEDPPRLTCEEKVLKIRRRLEKIVFKKEPEEKASDLLDTLDRMMPIPENVLNLTKIDLTLEALKFAVKEPALKERVDKSAIKLKAVRDKNKSNQGVINDRHKWRESTASGSRSVKPASHPHYKSSTNLKVTEETLKSDNSKRDCSKLGKSSPDEVEADGEEKSATTASNSEAADSAEKTGDEAASSATTEEGASSYMRLSYWMDKLMSGVDKLNLLDSKIDQISKTVEKDKAEQAQEEKKEQKAAVDKVLAEDSADSEPKKKISPDHHQPKKGENGAKPKTKTSSSNVFEDELLSITHTLDKVKIKDPQTKEEPKEAKIKVSEGKKSRSKLPSAATVEADKSVLAKLTKIDEELKKYSTAEPAAVKALLTEASQLSVDIGMLRTVPVGTIVNKIRKDAKDGEVRDAAKALVKKWKKLLPQASAEGKEQASCSAAATTEKKGVSADDVRQHCVGVLESALNNNNSLSSNCKILAERLAKEIEEEIFQRYKETNQKYRAQINSRRFNLTKNLTLQENVLLGNVTPAKLAVMTFQEMAPEQVKEARAKLESESLKSLPSAHVPDSSCTCRICLPPWIANN